MIGLRAALTMVLAGLLVGILDFRVEGVDLLPDPVGLLLAAVGVLATRRHGFPPGWTTIAAAAFLVAAVLAVPDALQPEPTLAGIHVTPRDAAALAQQALLLAQDVALGATMMALALAAAARGAHALARHARWLAYAFATLLALGLLLDALWLADVDEDVLLLGLVLLVPQLLAFILALVLLWRARDLAPPDNATESSGTLGTV